MKNSFLVKLFVVLAFIFTIQTIFAEVDIVKLKTLSLRENWHISNDAIVSPTPLLLEDMPVVYMQAQLKSHPASAWYKITARITSKTDAVWRKFDRLAFYVMAKAQPEVNLPPLRLLCQIRNSGGKVSDSTIIRFPKLGVWTYVSIPIREIKNLDRINAIQFIFAKKWAKYTDSIDFYFGGFYLVKSNSTLPAEPVLLTPSVSLNFPLLYLHAKENTVVSITGKKEGIQLTPVAYANDKLIFDISKLGLNYGVNELNVSDAQNNIHKKFKFEWLPLKVLVANIGKGLIGINTATAEIENSSDNPLMVKGIIELGGKELVAKHFKIEPQGITNVKMEWLLSQNTTDNFNFRIVCSNKCIYEVSKYISVKTPLDRIPSYMAVSYAPGKPVSLRVPVSLSEETRKDTKIHWTLIDKSGNELVDGKTTVDEYTPLILIPGLETHNAGRYSLELSIDGKYKQTRTIQIYLVEKIDNEW